MSVERIEKYGDVLKIILKPTEKFPVGYFYTDNNPVARQLVESYTWHLYKNKNNIYVIVNTYGQRKLYFHQEYSYLILGYYPDYLDHINGLEIDNRDSNLNVVTNQQNARNRPSKGYLLSNKTCFQPYYALDKKLIYRGTYHTEPEVLSAVYLLRQEVYSDYDYQFLEDRRNYSDLVDKEIRGIITHEEASYIRAKDLIESNPWYVYRYGLEDYCKEHNILIPNFDIDSQGFMINPVTKQRLCPY